ncbi:aspartyl/glutamyl-tRNA amidotransferase subunit A [Candidatus Uhrbacteria bacterium RIFCSPHIGHO2_01_FULL_63_20]|uniref:Glutamyl-tRNA(Gln) amidotransferase subunit A n=1 Tax=Candidatus Uhrbacteria bacterium RIFCSPHIGHO2_01_FULL_63_20 TaxID=1802385 RepID=A0A1F7TKD1_9BACT|nr:MAG: aspartyl/glutamyl-tRNA amidotransferase subunit A [Candidatus Uhrbacteria bacterium RIFCSPHIGHO2_01_FULL_63_20]
MGATDMTLREAAARMAAGERSSEELVRTSLGRIAAVNEKVNAVLEVDSHAIDAARDIDRRRKEGEELGPLAGIPVAVKDNILVRGWRASAGSRILETHTAAYDATVIARLREAGAIPVARTNMDEFAMGSSTESSHFGPTRNPWDLDRVPGGSSGGSAAAVASGMVSVALGSDTGGSVRQPASLCGVVGLKPTYGRVSRYGLIALASSLDQVGPFARTVEDAAILMRAIEGEDPRDATTVGPLETYVPELDQPSVKGLRIGLPKEYFVEGMDPRVKAGVMDAVRAMEAAGATAEEVSLPHARYALATYYLVMPAEASSNLARFDGIRYGYSAGTPSLRETYEMSRGEGFGEEAKRRIMLGAHVLSKGYAEAYYRQALKARTLIRRDFDEAFKTVDVIATPTSPCAAWRMGEKSADPLTMYLADIYTISANLAGIPALSLPCGFSDGLPIGLQLMGRPFSEATLFRAGMTYQSLTTWHTLTPTL